MTSQARPADFLSTKVVMSQSSSQTDTSTSPLRISGKAVVSWQWCCLFSLEVCFLLPITRIWGWRWNSRLMIMRLRLARQIKRSPGHWRGGELHITSTCWALHFSCEKMNPVVASSQRWPPLDYTSWNSSLTSSLPHWIWADCVTHFNEQNEAEVMQGQF